MARIRLTVLGLSGGLVLCTSAAYMTKKRASAAAGASSWDFNWDGRQGYHSYAKPSSAPNLAGGDQAAEIVSPGNNAASSAKVKKATRHIILIRHGQYFMDAEKKSLTELGKQQADATGRRLTELDYPITRLVASTMTRAAETADIICKGLPASIPRQSDPLLEEGAPAMPDPPSPFYSPAKQTVYEDGARIEAAFRKYIHRADPEESIDSYEVLVCHGNVIRYFVCRALQFAPEAWLRISVPNGSITKLVVRPDGRISLSCIGNVGHYPPEMITLN